VHDEAGTGAVDGGAGRDGTIADADADAGADAGADADADTGSLGEGEDATVSGDAGSAGDVGVAADAGAPWDAGVTEDAGACGYRGEGAALHVAPGIDICLAPAACTSETCPPGMGQCVGGKCVFVAGNRGIATLPEAWATYYCDLAGAGCHGVSQVDFPEVTAQKVATAMGLPLCTTAGAGATCVGVSASPPMMVGNSQVAIDMQSGMRVADWGLGLTEASGLCYRLTGPGGTVVVASTDRCGGLCQCGGSGYVECGACVNAPDMHPDCPCVGTVPGLYTSCCGRTCVSTPSPCDWCASNNHPHFDLDVATYDAVCGAQAALGSCRLTGATYFPCLAPLAWPPH
jgi:hypothetical protein